MHIEPTEFSPPRGLESPHLQTILSSVGPRRFLLNRIKKGLGSSAEAKVFEASDGTRLQGYFNVPDPHRLSSPSRAQTLVILLHGWEGGHESSYMLSAASSLLAAGYAVLRLNLRDHGETHHLNEQAFNSTMLDEVVDVVERLQREHVFARYHLAGFSLGGNFALRVAAASANRQIALESVSAFCPVVHAEQANKALSMSKNWLYNAYFVRKWKRSLVKKSDLFPHRYQASDFASLTSLDEMNQQLIPKYTRFKVLSEYFDAYAIVGKRLERAICPCYLHFAQDDMIIPIEGVEQIDAMNHVHIKVTRFGGHCGFLSSWRFTSWQDERLLQIVSAFEPECSKS